MVRHSGGPRSTATVGRCHVEMGELVLHERGRLVIAGADRYREKSDRSIIRTMERGPGATVGTGVNDTVAIRF